MKPFRWSSEKNESLASDRGISFEAVVVAIESGGLLDVLAHPDQSRYPRQRILVVGADRHVHLVPFVEEEEFFFLKTSIPSRKATRQYLTQETAMPKTDPYEREVIAAFDRGSLKSVATKAELARFKAAARATALKDKRVNIRLSSGDLNDIQVKVLEEGIPYQTFIASVLHKYVTGRLADRPAPDPEPARSPKQRTTTAR
jgi:predicted DNA binding CopG/RHH family protein/uncharacterized DUF497 family protein